MRSDLGALTKVTRARGVSSPGSWSKGEDNARVIHDSKSTVTPVLQSS
jgi:hypothetical protein